MKPLIKTVVHLFNRNDIVEKHLLLNNRDVALEKAHPDERFDVMLDRFLREELKVDGVFILNMIDDNCGSAVTDQLVNGLWESFVGREFPSREGKGIWMRMRREFGEN